MRRPPVPAVLTGVLTAVAVLAAACGTSTSDGAGDAGAPAATVDAPSALDDPTADGLPEPLVDPAELRSGGPPPDGIPPIDEPSFLDVDEVDFLEPEEPVLALEIGDDARAYPVQVLIWHEIVNDVVGGTPVAVTYCPLCNSALAFDRQVDDPVLDGGELTFGTSGMLYQSALVMYDRQTESLWSHFTGEAIAGVLTGTELEQFTLTTVSWADWSAQHPDGRVLSRDTGHDRDYGSNPYPGYDDVSSPPFMFEGEVDDRLAAKTRVVGAGRDDDPVAIVNDELQERGVVSTSIDGRPVTVWSLPGTASALEEQSVSGGRDVGATAVFVAEHEGREPRVRASRRTLRRDHHRIDLRHLRHRPRRTARGRGAPLPGARRHVLVRLGRLRTRDPRGPVTERPVPSRRARRHRFSERGNTRECSER
ncbi:MAG: DUF3179 domain-containing protein [Acidimicrobiia bacterium]|nr:DUF3179 domain-containing protein [Acidimicrobiia bacterium]